MNSAPNSFPFCSRQEPPVLIRHRENKPQALILPQRLPTPSVAEVTVAWLRAIPLYRPTWRQRRVIAHASPILIWASSSIACRSKVTLQPSPEHAHDEAKISATPSCLVRERTSPGYSLSAGEEHDAQGSAWLSRRHARRTNVHAVKVSKTCPPLVLKNARPSIITERITRASLSTKDGKSRPRSSSTGSR